MTLEEKINHLRTTSMEEARAESNAIIDSYRDALEKVFEDHKIEAKRQMQTRIKAETVNNVIVDTKDLTDQIVLQIKEITVSQLGCSYEDVTIIQSN